MGYTLSKAKSQHKYYLEHKEHIAELKRKRLKRLKCIKCEKDLKESNNKVRVWNGKSFDYYCSSCYRKKRMMEK